MKNTLVVIVGPTGVGKTELCLQIAEHLDIPIINADSRQIYKELPIGTAAPTIEQQQRVKHYFVGTRHIEDYYNASMFEQDVLNTLKEHFLSKPVALLTGGSMMYIDAVCNGIDDIPTITPEIRAEMKGRLDKEGLPILLADLKSLDPEYYAIVDKNNTRRVVHALEICHMTGKTYTSFRTRNVKPRPFKVLKIGLERPREELYRRINERVLHMMELGLEREALALYPQRGLTSLNAVGYRELFDYFDQAISKEEAVRRIQSNTRRYMRKQLTWFKKDKQIKWFYPSNIEEIIKYIDEAI